MSLFFRSGLDLLGVASHCYSKSSLRATVLEVLAVLYFADVDFFKGEPQQVSSKGLALTLLPYSWLYFDTEEPTVFMSLLDWLYESHLVGDYDWNKARGTTFCGVIELILPPGVLKISVGRPVDPLFSV